MCLNNARPPRGAIVTSPGVLCAQDLRDDAPKLFDLLRLLKLLGLLSALRHVLELRMRVEEVPPGYGVVACPLCEVSVASGLTSTESGDHQGTRCFSLSRLSSLVSSFLGSSPVNSASPEHPGVATDCALPGFSLSV